MEFHSTLPVSYTPPLSLFDLLDRFFSRIDSKLWACPVVSDSEEGIISGLFGFKVGWGLVVKTGVESGAIVEGFDVMEDGATRFG